MSHNPPTDSPEEAKSFRPGNSQMWQVRRQTCGARIHRAPLRAQANLRPPRLPHRGTRNRIPPVVEGGKPPRPRATTTRASGTRARPADSPGATQPQTAQPPSSRPAGLDGVPSASRGPRDEHSRRVQQHGKQRSQTTLPAPSSPANVRPAPPAHPGRSAFSHSIHLHASVTRILLGSKGA